MWKHYSSSQDSSVISADTIPPSLNLCSGRETDLKQLFIIWLYFKGAVLWMLWEYMIGKEQCKVLRKNSVRWWQNISLAMEYLVTNQSSLRTFHPSILTHLFILEIPHKNLLLFKSSLKYTFIDYFREWGKGEGETSVGCLPDWGLNAQPSYVPWVKLTVFPYTGWYASQLARGRIFAISVM